MRRAPDTLLARVPAVRDALRTPGRPLDRHHQSEFESQLPRSEISPPAQAGMLGVTSPGDVHEREANQGSRPANRASDSRDRLDFSRVRVHTDAAAADSARAVGARAYTVGNDIVFGGGEYAPQRESGRRLLAHELMHTAQPGSEHRLARDPITGYETKPVDFSRSDIEKMTGGSYWEQKIAAQFDIIYVNTVQSRFSKDNEERDAAMSALWTRKPAGPVKSDSTVSVSIPPRTGLPKSQALLYQFQFSPPSQKDALPQVKIDLSAEGSAAVVSAAPQAAAGYAPPTFSRSGSGFPDGIDKYWKDHPDEHRQLYQWVENQPGPKFSQSVTTNSTTAQNKKHDSTYRVTGEKDTANQKMKSLDIELLSETPTFIENPPQGYASKDRTDLELDKQKAKTTAADKLGAITGLDTAPADEQLSVKYVIWQYFAGGTRNKEVDVVIPIANKTTKVYYTLRFKPGNNDVEVKRIGEEGSDIKNTATAMNITRVEGFQKNSTDPTAFKAWIAKRYPGVTPQGNTLPELQDSVNKEMQGKAGAPEWFKKNYTMEVLGATSGEARLQTTHKLSSAETADMKEYSSTDLQRLEFALETMSDPELQIVKGTQMARQKVLIEIKNKIAMPDAKTGGMARTSGSDRTITIYDSASGNEDKLFAGGGAGIRPASVQTYTHELGHILGGAAGIESEFTKFVKEKKIKPITWYAASKPATESFPEAFAIYQTDPEWMQTNLPELFLWFEDVKKNGKPPVTP